MTGRARGTIVAALLAAWGALLLWNAAPTWRPDVPTLAKLGASLARAPTAEPADALVHHAAVLGAVLVLHAVLAGAGLVAARWLGGGGAPAAWPLAWGAGFGVLSLWGLGLGLAGLCFPWPVVGGGALLGAAGLRGLKRGRLPRLRLPPGAWERTLAAVLAAGAAVLFLLAVAPDTSWDAVVYHLRVPTFFIQEHRIFHVPTNHFTAFPLATEMHYAWLMLLGGVERTGGGEAPKVFHLSCALVTAWAAARLARRFAGGGAAPVAAALVVVSPFTGTIAVRAYNDFAQAALSGLIAVLLAERGRGAAVCAGWLLGAALSAKYTAVFLAAPLALWWFRLRPAPWLAAALLLAPWTAKSFLLTGNPAAPFLSRWFPSGPETSFQFAAYAASLGGPPWNPFAWGAAVWGLVRGAAGESLTELLPCLLAAGLLLGRPARGERAVRRYAGAFAGLWVLFSPAIRFFAAGLAPVAALAGAGWGRAEGAYGGRALRPLLGTLLFLDLLRLPLAHCALFDPLPFSLGRESVWDNVARSAYPAPYYGRIADWANRNLPASARVLYVIDIKAHYVWRRTYHDFQYVQPGLLRRWERLGGSLPGLLKKLRQEGVSHLMVVFQKTREVGDHYAWTGPELADTAAFLAAWTRSEAKTEHVEVLRVLRTPLPRRNVDDYGWILFTNAENVIARGGDAQEEPVLAEALRRAPWLSPARGLRGIALARLGRFDEAERELAACARTGGLNAAEASMVLGQVRRHRNDLAGSERALREAIRLKSQYPEAHYQLGALLYAAKRRSEALREAQEAVRQDPANAEYRGLVGALTGTPAAR